MAHMTRAEPIKPRMYPPVWPSRMPIPPEKLAALMAVCSWISIPTAIPFTLQTMAVFLAVGLLGGKRGTLAVTAYVLLGAVGAPVFANFSGGIGILLGQTGGYILGFRSWLVSVSARAILIRSKGT